MEHQSKKVKVNSIGTNRTIGTNGRAECTPTQSEAIRDFLSLTMRCISPVEYQSNKCYSIDAIRDILSRYNEMDFTNRTPIE